MTGRAIGWLRAGWGRLPEGLRAALLLYLAIRLPVELVVVISDGMLPRGPGAIGMPPLDGPDWLKLFLRWDSGWYVRIIRDGYSYADCRQAGVACPQSSIAFFPGFPAAVRAFMGLGLSLTVSSFLVVHLALLMSLWGMLDLAKLKLGDDEAAWRSAVALLAFPTAGFLSVGYAEGLFLAFALWALVWLERGNAPRAAVLFAWGAVTRFQGVVLVGAVVLVSLCRRRWREALILGIPAGVLFGIFLLSQYLAFGDALAFDHAQRAWGFAGQPAIELVGTYWRRTVSGELLVYGWLDFAAIAWLAGSAAWAWLRLGAVYGGFVAGVLLMPLSSGHVWCLSRFALCAFPGVLWLGVASRRRPVALLLLTGGLALVVVSMLRFSAGLFIAS
jgi:hypothetical protein